MDTLTQTETETPAAPSRLERAMAALTNHQQTSAALKAARATIASLTADVETARADHDAAVSSLEAAVADRDALAAELAAAGTRVEELAPLAAQAAETTAALTAAREQITHLEAASRTVTAAVTAELATIGVGQEDLPATERAETEDTALSLLAKFEAAKDGNARLAVIREARSKGIKLSAVASGLN